MKSNSQIEITLSEIEDTIAFGCGVQPDTVCSSVSCGPGGTGTCST